MVHDAVAVVDFGGQYAHLIATKVRKHRVLAEIRQPEDPIEAFAPYKGIILSGSPSLSAFGEDSAYNKGIYDLDVPIMGFCFGHQEIAKHYGGKVSHGQQEWGRADLHITREHALFAGLEPVEQVWMSHFDSVDEIGPEFVELASSVLGANGERHRYAAIASDALRRYGFQYHPEVDDTLHGDEMIGNFVLGICGCRPSWTMERYLDEQVERVRRQVDGRSVFLLASGGVDSTVAAYLFRRALAPEQLHLLHIDNGLMRKDESAEVVRMLAELEIGENLHFVDAGDDFLAALERLVEPERKRKAIGNTFIQVFEREARRLHLESHLLGQGTIYPDTIETGGTKRADTIKTHHNRVPIIEEMIAAGKVVEPLVDLYKVEVRDLGEKLGVPADLIGRHPFPGPGLGVRLLCSDGAPALDGEALGAVQSQVDPLLEQYRLKGRVLPLKSVGVKADLRSYESPVLLHGEADWDTLEEAAGTLFKSVSGINRCIWSLAGPLPERFEVVAASVSRTRLDLLREVDAIVTEGLLRHGLYGEVWQCPVVLAPLKVDGRGVECCILRPIRTERGMTATPARLPMAMLAEAAEAILAFPAIGLVAYDVTSKPPGTIEWE
jgi:GMP synthase (glutamine-hydrolysing)